MQDTISAPDTSPLARLKSLSSGQWLMVGVGALLAAFLIIGTVLQSSSAEPDPLGATLTFGEQPFAILAGLALMGGVLSFISPCTLPVLTAYFAFAFRSGRTQIFTNTVAFMLGLATTFSLLGAGASAIGAVLFQNQFLILLVGGSLILAFGVMSILGSGFGGMSAMQGGERSTTVGGSYVFGLTFAVGWSSCVGPILGAVLALASYSASVPRGMILLFLYTLGIGLPLILVSTFLGRTSRQSLIWRFLRGWGREVSVPLVAIALAWALVFWRILLAVVTYGFRNFDFLAGQQITAVHTYGLLALAVAGALLWVFTSPGERKRSIHLHSTQLISGGLFVFLGLLMLDGRLTSFNSIVPQGVDEWLTEVQSNLLESLR